MSKGNTPASEFELLTFTDQRALVREASVLRGEYALDMGRKLRSRIARAISGRHASPPSGAHA